MWRISEQPFLRTPLQGAATLARLARARPTSPTIAPWQTLRGPGRALPRATRACAPCSTATPPTPAPIRGARRRCWPPCPTWSRRSAPGTCAAACTGSAWRSPTRAAARGAVVRTGCAVRRVLVEGGRAAGVRAGRRRAAAGRRRRLRRGRRGALRPTCCRQDRRTRGVRRDLAPGHAVALGIRAAARPARPDAGPGAPHRALPRRLRRRVRRRLRHRPLPRVRRGRWPTRPSTSARRTTRRCAPTTTASRGSCWSTPRGTTRSAGSTGTRPAWPSATPTGCST